jgi:hypothetical protein
MKSVSWRYKLLYVKHEILHWSSFQDFVLMFNKSTGSKDCSWIDVEPTHSTITPTQDTCTTNADTLLIDEWMDHQIFTITVPTAAVI